MPQRDLAGRKQSHKRRYKKILQDMILMIQGELGVIDDDDYEVRHNALETSAFQMIQEANALKALMQVEEQEPSQEEARS